MEKIFDFAEGEVLLIDKPLEWTSFDVVKKIRNAIRLKKIGHAGTLDPLATGLLILCTGKKTKKIDEYQAQEKEYTGTLVLGKTTASFDLETEIQESGDPSALTTEQLLQAAKDLTGPQMQIPPMYSAIRVNGKRLYQLARKGKTEEEVEIKPRAVEITLFEIETSEFPQIHFRIVCSKGTYIRSLVRDFGDSLGCGAYMSALRRTRIGEFSVDRAHTLDAFIQLVKSQQINP
ncbi:MAG: tRNA pseudouridine(55) synthase TruB [Cytophagaceae bacterium]|jgi:tRNA pseudouridine55 synthase|nr:tRNA pseudouridine(55) synthase TruB [Cytophagaceae bacterium]